MGVQEQGAGIFSMKWGFSFSLQIAGFLLQSHMAKREETSLQASSSNVPISLWQLHNLDLTYP